ncbi:MAG: hypothetical protein QMD76_00240 [Anaerosomatales bacterium]|nr:hypothetical protein [Anaerosomatales bacterium]
MTSRARVHWGLVRAFALCLLIVVACEGTAAAATPSLVATAPVSRVTTGYDLDFTLPTQSKSGCLVCHGDPDLVRLKAGKVTSYYVAPGEYGLSVHGKEQCVACHLDFAYKLPHDTEVAWQVTAKTACRNCHGEQFVAFGKGVHQRAVDATGTRVSVEASKPLCGDCHGSHAIQKLTDSKAGQAALHASGWDVCGRCHQDYWESYDDYYHGAAYKRGAKDAPACWDCHGWHDILPAKDRKSRVNEANLVETCGQEGCHKRSTVGEDFVASYVDAIHHKTQAKQDNPMYKILRQLFRFVLKG